MLNSSSGAATPNAWDGTESCPPPTELIALSSAGAAMGLKGGKKNRSKRWDPIALPDTAVPEDVLALTPLPPGAEIVFYPHNMKRMFTAPTEQLLCTKGLVEFVNEFNAHGPSKTKTKLYSCTMYVQTGVCSNGYACREVHFVHREGEPVAMPPEIRSNEVHQRDVPLETYKCLPPGHMIALSLPNMSHSSEKFPTERIFVTKGVQEYYDEMLVGQPTMNMQHCAHFAKNGMCCFGPECRFVHVANFSIEPHSDSHSESGSAKSNRSSGGSRNGTLHSLAVKRTPLSTDDSREENREVLRRQQSGGSSTSTGSGTRFGGVRGREGGNSLNDSSSSSPHGAWVPLPAAAQPFVAQPPFATPFAFHAGGFPAPFVPAPSQQQQPSRPLAPTWPIAAVTGAQPQQPYPQPQPQPVYFIVPNGQQMQQPMVAAFGQQPMFDPTQQPQLIFAAPPQPGGAPSLRQQQPQSFAVPSAQFAPIFYASAPSPQQPVGTQSQMQWQQ